jgi:hypothetical protein
MSWQLRAMLELEMGSFALNGEARDGAHSYGTWLVKTHVSGETSFQLRYS